jgi:hypothetical protein
MSRSPADAEVSDGAVKASELLTALERAYDDALTAAMSGDLESCANLLAACDTLLARSHEALHDEPCEDARQGALAAHARLSSVLTAQREETAQDLARVQLGKKALQGYAGERQLGSRVERQA